MGMVGAQALPPCPRTDQYFSSKGTKHLAKQLLLNSFTHWSGTPRNTHLYTVGVCGIEGIQGPQELLPSAEVTVWRDESLEEVLGLCVCVLTWFLLLPTLDHLSFCPFFTHARTSLPVCGVERERETLWQRERKRSVLYFVLPAFDISTSAFVAIHLLRIPFWMWSLAVFLQSFHRCILPAFLSYCDASITFTVSTCSLSVRHFTQK